MKSKFVVLLSFNLLVSSFAFAESYECKIGSNYQPLTFELSQDLKTGKMDDRSFLVGQKFFMGTSSECVKWKNQGLCLLGPNDPYEMCQTVCKQWGDKSTFAIILSDIRGAAILKFDSEVKVKGKVKVGPTSREVNCYRTDVHRLVENSALIVRENNETIIYRKKEFMSTTDAGILKASYAGISVSSEKESVVTLGEIIKKSDSKMVTIVEPNALKDVFNIKKIKAAVCRGLTSFESVFDFSLSKNSVEINDVTPQNSRRDVVQGELVVVGGKTQIAINGNLFPILKVSDSDFYVNQLLCHVRK